MEENGKILSVSKSHLGRTYDFRIRKQEKQLPTNNADSGYWVKILTNVIIPFKKTK